MPMQASTARIPARRSRLFLPRPKTLRTYRNVRVHISRPHHVGKERLAKQATTEWPTIAREASSKVSVNSKVLTITHKSTKHLLKHKLSCREHCIAHWHNLDGKNEWRDADAVLLYGLPYPDDIAPTEDITPGTGQWSTEWFDGNRKYARHSDIKAAINNNRIDSAERNTGYQPATLPDHH